MASRTAGKHRKCLRGHFYRNSQEIRRGSLAAIRNRGIRTKDGRRESVTHTGRQENFPHDHREAMLAGPTPDLSARQRRVEKRLGRQIRRPELKRLVLQPHSALYRSHNGMEQVLRNWCQNRSCLAHIAGKSPQQETPQPRRRPRRRNRAEEAPSRRRATESRFSWLNAALLSFTLAIVHGSPRFKKTDLRASQGRAFSQIYCL